MQMEEVESDGELKASLVPQKEIKKDKKNTLNTSLTVFETKMAIKMAKQEKQALQRSKM